MADPRGAHAGFRQAIIEPGGGAVAQVRTGRLVNGIEHLQQDKDGTRKGQRSGERMAALDRAHQHTHGDREPSGQTAAQKQDGPPGSRQPGVRFGQDAEELPFLARPESLEHAFPPPQKITPL
jgi:hypothetical protein